MIQVYKYICVYTYIIFHIIFPYRLLQNIEYNIVLHLDPILYIVVYIWGFPGGSDGKESTCNAGDLGSIPGLGRYPREGHGNPLQYSCLENTAPLSWTEEPHGIQSMGSQRVGHD